MPIRSGENHPSRGVEFRTRGHYGSSIIDNGATIELNVCDPCLRLKIDTGKVHFKRDGAIRIWLRTKMNIITPSEVRDWFVNASDEEIQEFLDEGLDATIHDLEQDDFFGTEGFNKRFA